MLHVGQGAKQVRGSVVCLCLKTSLLYGFGSCINSYDSGDEDLRRAASGACAEVFWHGLNLTYLSTILPITLSAAAEGPTDHLTVSIMLLASSVSGFDLSVSSTARSISRNSMQDSWGGPAQLLPGCLCYGTAVSRDPVGFLGDCGERGSSAGYLARAQR